jgi:cardiolipin synthase
VVLAFWLGGLLSWPVFVLILLPDVVLSLIALIVFGGASFPVTWVGKVRTALIFVGLLMLLVGVAVVAEWRGSEGGDGPEVLGQLLVVVSSFVLLLGLVGHYVAAVLYGRDLARRWRARGRTAA